jgi:hypothetical protein
MKTAPSPGLWGLRLDAVRTLCAGRSPYWCKAFFTCLGILSLLGRRIRSTAVIGCAHIAHQPDYAQHQADHPEDENEWQHW